MWNYRKQTTNKKLSHRMTQKTERILATDYRPQRSWITNSKGITQEFVNGFPRITEKLELKETENK
jgi:hypothetical protein